MATNPQSGSFISPAIQNGADNIVALIELEKAKNSHKDFQALESQAEIAQARQELLEVECRLKEVSLAHAESECQLQELRGECDKLRTQTSEALQGSMAAYQEAELARKTLDQLKADLEGAGIYYCGQNTLRFGVEWDDVLAELGNPNPGSMTPERVPESLGKLAQRLKWDSEALKHYEKALRLAEEEREQIKRNTQTEIEALKLHISSLQPKADLILTNSTEHPLLTDHLPPSLPPTSFAGMRLYQIAENAADSVTAPLNRLFSTDADGFSAKDQ